MEEGELRDVTSHHRKRRPRSALATAAVAAAVILVSAPAAADPPVPEDAPEAVQQLVELNHKAEVLTEQWHHAKDQLDTRRAELDRARADASAAAAAGNQARASHERFRGQIDRLASASFQGARLHRLSALLVSDSPEEFLDQMSALDLLAADHNEAMRQLAGALQQARQAERTANDAAAHAAAVEQHAARLEDDLSRARAEMDRQIELVQERLDELTAQERASYTSGGEIDFSVSVVGSGAAAEAVRAALSKQGAPYRWGAEGPGSFDCSGLTSWAYEQVGVNLPRSSREQARSGSGVNRSQLRPGDLVALYSPVSHIGLYVGDGRYVNAPQSGDVVKVSPVPWDEVTAMRRVG